MSHALTLMCRHASCRPLPRVRKQVGPSAALPGIAEFKSTLMHVLEAISQVRVWGTIKRRPAAGWSGAGGRLVLYAQPCALPVHVTSRPPHAPALRPAPLRVPKLDPTPPPTGTTANHPPQHEILLQHSGAFMAHLLPAYCAAIAAPSESADARFFCLRMLSDALGACLSDPDLYDASLSSQGGANGGSGGGGGGSGAGAHDQQQQQGGAGGGSGGGAGHGAATAALDGLLRGHVLPLVPALLGQEDPMPLYALKVGRARARVWLASCSHERAHESRHNA